MRKTLPTHCRYNACSDNKRNAVALAAACQVMVPSANYRLIIHRDGTQFKVGHDSKGSITTFYIEDETEGPLKLKTEK